MYHGKTITICLVCSIDEDNRGMSMCEGSSRPDCIDDPETFSGLVDPSPSELSFILQTAHSSFGRRVALSVLKTVSIGHVGNVFYFDEDSRMSAKKSFFDNVGARSLFDQIENEGSGFGGDALLPVDCKVDRVRGRMIMGVVSNLKLPHLLFWYALIVLAGFVLHGYEERTIMEAGGDSLLSNVIVRIPMCSSGPSLQAGQAHGLVSFPAQLGLRLLDRKVVVKGEPLDDSECLFGWTDGFSSIIKGRMDEVVCRRRDGDLRCRVRE